MNEQLEEIMEEVKEIKDEARGKRKDEDHLGAVRCYKKAIKKLTSIPLPAPDDAQAAASWEIEVAKQLADCYGSMGGAYRDAGRLPDSIKAYDAGYVYESAPRYSYRSNSSAGIVNSYNLVQRLISRILHAPKALESTASASAVPLPEGKTIAAALQDALVEIARQLSGPRHNDYWAMADLALISLLAGNEATANETWDKFDQANPMNHAYGTTLQVIRQLAAKELPMKDSLQKAALRLEQRLASLRQT